MSKDNTFRLHIVSQDSRLVRRFSILANEYANSQSMRLNITYADDLLASLGAPLNLLIIDLESLSDSILQQLSRIHAEGLHPWVVVTYQEPSSDRLLASMRAGVNDYLNYHPEVADVRELFIRASGAQVMQSSSHRGQLITVFSNKGGVGTTMAAINIASEIKQKIDGAVVVVDLVLQHGDISVFLDVPTQYTVVNLVNDIDRADPSYLFSALPKHASGLYVLPAPFVADEAELVNAGQILRLLDILRNAFDAVVVDAGNEFNEQTLTALDASDRMVLITLPTLPSIRNTRRSLDLFNRLGYNPSRILLVANRHDAKEKVDVGAMQEALSHEIDWSLPNDYIAVTRAINQGTTLRLIQPKAKITASFSRFIDKFLLRASDRKDLAEETRKSGIKKFFGG